MAANEAEVLLPASATDNREHIASTNPSICRYYLLGMCRFGSLCRFSHDLSGSEEAEADSAVGDTEKPSTSRRKNWANAPVFVPQQVSADSDVVGATSKSWADVVGNGSQEEALSAQMEFLGIESEHDLHRSKLAEQLCPYMSPCPYKRDCLFGFHMELCKMCDLYCLHPQDAEQRRKHNQECLEQHEKDMELSFAIARSKDKTCGICFDTIVEKAGREKRFGILPNCNHIFCLECIRKWRQAKQFEHKIIRSCPECRVSSDFVCPSAFWVDTKEDKDKLLTSYRSALGVKDCKYFNKGAGKCPFANKCFYKHALPNGSLVDVGNPKRPRKARRSSNEIVDLLDIYLWEFVAQRGEFNFMDLLSNTSDDSDISDDWSVDEQ